MKLKPTLALLVSAFFISACAQNAMVQRGQEQVLKGQRDAANASFKDALKAEPTNERILGQQLQNQMRYLNELWVRFDALIAESKIDPSKITEAREIIGRITREDPRNPRLASGFQQIEVAANLRPQTVSPAPENTRSQSVTTPAPRRIPALEFRDAPLRSVLEALGKLGAISYVFDKDVRTDTRITIALRDVSAEEALRVILLSQQLDSKSLNAGSVLIFPVTAPKSREYVELQSRSFFLNNIDAKQAQALIKSLVKTRDTFIDEKLNLLVIKDTPAAITLAERLIESVDLAEPEVMLDVVVLEVASSKTQELGLRYPSQLQFGLPTSLGNVLTEANWRNQIVSTNSPSLVANIKSTLGKSDLLSNPNIRVKNREKARIHIGEKLPVFTSSFTTGTNNSGTNTAGTSTNAFSTQISFLEVGLKLDVEPQIFLQNEVSIKLGLEVSNVIEKVQGPADSLGYRIGTRNTATTLRLRDGETQVIAGLIRDEDRRSAAGIPGLSGLPILGRLFGNHNDETDRTEIILMITPRIIRNVDPTRAAQERFPAGTESNIGALPVRLSNNANLAIAVNSAGGQSAARQPPNRSETSPQAAAESTAQGATSQPLEIRLSGPPSASAGATFDIVISHTGQDSLTNATVELSLSGDGITSLDGSRGPLSIALTGTQTVIKLKAGLANRTGTVEITGARNPNEAITLAPTPPMLNVRVLAP